MCNYKDRSFAAHKHLNASTPRLAGTGLGMGQSGQDHDRSRVILLKWQGGFRTTGVVQIASTSNSSDAAKRTSAGARNPAAQEIYPRLATFCPGLRKFDPYAVVCPGLIHMPPIASDNCVGSPLMMYEVRADVDALLTGPTPQF
jgi:hypothetical protein